MKPDRNSTAPGCIVCCLFALEFDPPYLAPPGKSSAVVSCKSASSSNTSPFRLRRSSRANRLAASSAQSIFQRRKSPNPCFLSFIEQLKLSVCSGDRKSIRKRLQFQAQQPFADTPSRQMTVPVKRQFGPINQSRNSGRILTTKKIFERESACW